MTLTKGSLRLVIFETEDGVLAFNDPGYDEARKSLANKLDGGLWEFSFRDRLGAATSKMGSLKSMVVERGLLGRQILDDVTMPLGLVFDSFRYREEPHRISKYRKDLLTNESNSSLFVAFQYLIFECFSHASAKEVFAGNLPVILEGNRVVVCALFYSKNEPVVRYVGFLGKIDN